MSGKWSQYPGEKLIKSVEFAISGEVIEYHGSCECSCGCKRKTQYPGGWKEGKTPDWVKKCSGCDFGFCGGKKAGWDQLIGENEENKEEK